MEEALDRLPPAHVAHTTIVSIVHRSILFVLHQGDPAQRLAEQGA
jgi:hypothetical protein